MKRKKVMLLVGMLGLASLAVLMVVRPSLGLPTGQAGPLPGFLSSLPGGAAVEGGQGITGKSVGANRPEAGPPSEALAATGEPRSDSQKGQVRPATGDASAGSGLLDRMIVYNTAVSLAVESVPESVNAIGALAEGVGGFVAGTSIRYNDDKEYATLTLRVPATAYNQVMNGLRRMAVKVVNENGSTRDVTEEFTDLDAQIRNLQAMEVQYLELLKRANTIDEILKVQARLSDVRGQIERNKGRMNLLQRTSDMATIAVTLSPADAVSVKKSRPAWDPATSVQEAWEQSLVIVRAVADVGLRVVVFSWWLLPPALLTWGVWAMSRRPQRGSVEV